jgi:hypothetical protein
VRLAQGAAERELDPRHPRGSRRRGEVRDHRECDCADPRRLDMPLRQSDRLAADRSDRNEDGDLHTLVPHLSDDRGE